MPQSKVDTSHGFSPASRFNREVGRAAADILRLDGLLEVGILSPQIHQVLLTVARSRNAVSSFRMEGERVELERVRAILDGQSPATRPEIGVKRLADAYAKLARGQIPDLSVGGICTLHRDMFSGILVDEKGADREAWVGTLKVQQNSIIDPGGVRFIPTPPGRTVRELEALLEWYDSVRGLWLPPIVAAVFFAEFQAIHPFMDGNGRIGRLLNVALLVDMGCTQAPLAPIDLRLFRSSDHYYELLATTNAGTRYDLWARYFVGEIRHAYRVARKQADLSDVVEKFTRSSTRSILSWILSGSGAWFSRGEFPNPVGYSQPALWAALDELSSAGIIESKGQRRGRRYRLQPRFLAGLYAGRV